MHPRAFLVISALSLTFFTAPAAHAEPSAAASAAFNTYVAQVEARIARQHQSPIAFLAPAPADRLRRGELIVESLTPDPAPSMPGAMLHHWRGTAFVAGATAADFERLMKNFNTYPQTFAPQVVKASILAQQGDRFQASMRVRQQHVITVVLDTFYDVVFGQLDQQHGYSISRSTRVSEIKSPGAPNKRVLQPSEENGFLWRLNNYWSYEQRDGGIYMQIESVSLTRSIPTGLAWAIRPFVEGVPRESLEFTLRSTCKALRKP
jgi:hypothetical protein